MILVCSLLGTPLPAQAANGMADMMRIMMEMFFWMMSGSSGGMSSVNPYSMGGLGNPLLGGGGWGNSPWRLGGNQSYLPYNNLGMYSPSLYGSSMYSPSAYSAYGYPGYSPYLTQPGNAYSTPYTNPYAGAANPYTGNRYNAYGVPPRSSYRGPYQAPPVIIQPVIIKQPQDSEEKKATLKKDGKRTAAGRIKPPAARVVPPPNYARDEVWKYDNPMSGKWQGINGEYLALGKENFYLRTRDAELKGTYQFKNGIMKVLLEDKPNPFYLQARIEKGELIFNSEDGQMMLFQRPRKAGVRPTSIPPANYTAPW